MGKVPGNDVSKVEMRVDGGWGGLFVQESWKLQLETRINGILAMDRPLTRKKFLPQLYLTVDFNSDSDLPAQPLSGVTAGVVGKSRMRPQPS